MEWGYLLEVTSLLAALALLQRSSGAAAASAKELACQEITVPLCKGIGYNYTYMPNQFNHDTQDEAGLEVHQFWPLVEIQCSPDLKFFLCSMYTPICLEDYKKPLPPCRSVCERAKAGCAPLMRQYGFAWPDRMRCDRLPEQGNPDTLCMDYNRTDLTTAAPSPPRRPPPPPPPPELCSMASRRMETKPVITCLKTLLIIYSFVFWITGVILLAVGVWGKLTLGTYISLIAENSTNAPYVLIGTGTTIVVFGLFGCFATCRGSPWMLKLYAMFLSLVFLAELVAGISGFVFRHEIKDTFLRTYTDAMQNYNGNDERSRAVDHVQRSLSCCGVQNYTNWSTSPYFLEHGIPPSCCMNETDCNPQDLHNLTVAATKVNQKGCYDLVTSFMETNMGIIAGVAFGIAFSQLIGMLLACCLSRFITANQYEMV